MALKRKSEEPPLVSYLKKNPKGERSKTNKSFRIASLVKFDIPMAPKRKRKLTRKESSSSVSKQKRKSSSRDVTAEPDEVEWSTRFLDEPISEVEAKNNWPERYNPAEDERKRLANLLKKTKKDGEHEEMIVQAKYHFKRVIVDERFVYELNDDAHVQSDEDEPYICKIVELFQGLDGNCYFTAQWFYRAVDTVIKTPHNTLINDKRVFFSEIRDTNAVCTLLKKLNIEMISLNETTAAAEECDYFCNMKYLLPFSTFEALQPSSTMASSGCSTLSSETEVNGGDATMADAEEACQVIQAERTDATLLDLYSGCGAMSTGLTKGTQLAGLKLVTKWAVDINEHACKSMRFNHPETQVRQEEAENFLSLLKEWKKLCVYFSLAEGLNSEEGANPYGLSYAEDDEADDGTGESDTEVAGEIFLVEKLLDICYGNPNNIKEQEPGLHFKVRWSDYGPSHDTWEPIQGLSHCRERIKEFVECGHKSSILPLPGSVDVVCGGPPCQGISGHNRFRNKEKPLEDKRNKQLKVYMDIIEFLKPKYVLMENVVDMLKFVKGYMARYAVGRLIQMNYQTRMGMMAAGAYGLAQYRMRFFLWGARSNESLPQFPRPTHDVDKRGCTPNDFSSNLVAYGEGHTVSLAPKLLLKDIISDLPEVTNSEDRDEMRYGIAPETPFQEVIRLSKNEMVASSSRTSKSTKTMLYNHIALNLNEYDIQRVAWVPKRKGACFRDFPGVKVGPNNVVEWDPDVERVMLGPNQPLVPDYAMTYRGGKSTKPFGRLWWDETVSTVVTRAEPHNQIILHPEQDRVLTIRENARLQGFPDHYKLFGPTKEKYCQVGNAVAVPVARALGFALGKAFQGLSNDDPLLTLPKGFPNLNEDVPSESSKEKLVVCV